MALDQFTYTQLEQYFKDKYLGYDYRDLRNTILTLQEIFGRDMNALRTFLESASDTITSSEQLIKAAQDYADEALGVAESVRTELNAVVGRVTDSDAMSRQAAIDAEGIDHINLKARADNDYLKTKERLNNTATKDEYEVSPSVISAYWESPDVPSIRSDGNSGILVSWKYQEMIDNLWEPLREANPEYVTRIDKGPASSGDNWYRYEFVPPKYEKTMIIVAGLHGAERLGIYSLYFFMNHVVNNWKEYPQLAYIRHKVRMIVVPCANPYGQNNLTRQNANGVDLNRNFDYLWSSQPEGQPWDHDYKGTEPFSEVESRYIRDTLEQYPDATSYLDLHNYGVGDSDNDFIVFSPLRLPATREIYRDIIDRYKTNDSNIHWKESENSTAYNYANDRFGMHGSNPEFQPGRYGDSHGSEDMTKALRWFGNVILQHARLQNNAKINATAGPFTIRTLFNRSGAELTIPSNDIYQNLGELELSFDVPVAGYVRIEGELIYVNTIPDETLVYIVPKLGQTGTDFLPETIQETRWGLYGEGKQRNFISFSAEIPVSPTTKGTNNPVVMGLYARKTGGSGGEIRIYRYRSTAQFIPSDKSDRVKLYTSTSRVGQGVGAMQIFYP